MLVSCTSVIEKPREVCLVVNLDRLKEDLAFSGMSVLV